MISNDPLVISVHQAFHAARRRDNPKPLETPGSVAISTFQPPLREPKPYDFMAPRRPRKEFRGPAPAARRMYLMQDQAPDARLWTVFDRASGVALGRVRGTAVWAREQILLLCQSQGARFDEVVVR